MDLRTNTDYFSLQQSLICFYNRGWECLLCGTNWAFKSDRYNFVLKGLRSSSSFVRLLHRHSVTFILPSLFPSITCFRRQFLRKIWPLQLAFIHFIVYRILLVSLTLCSTSTLFTRSVNLISILAPVPHSLPYNGYWVIPRGKAAGVCRWPPHLAPRLKKE